MDKVTAYIAYTDPFVYHGRSVRICTVTTEVQSLTHPAYAAAYSAACVMLGNMQCDAAVFLDPCAEDGAEGVYYCVSVVPFTESGKHVAHALTAEQVHQMYAKQQFVCQRSALCVRSPVSDTWVCNVRSM